MYIKVFSLKKDFEKTNRNIVKYYQQYYKLNLIYVENKIKV